MGRIGKPQKSKKHKRLAPVSGQYLQLWGDKKARRGENQMQSKQSIQEQKINAKPQKPDEQEIPQRLKELMVGKQKANERRKNTRKKNKDLLTDSGYQDRYQKGMTRPVEQTPRFQRRKYETDGDFIQRVEVQCKNFVDRRKFEVAHEIIKPEDDPVTLNVQNPEKSEKDTDIDVDVSRKPRPVKFETVKSIKNTSKAKTKKEKLANKKNATGFERFTDKVKFGEVVMAPPTLSAKPRGSTRTDDSSKKIVPNLLLSHKLPDSGKLDLTAKRKDLPPVTRLKLDTERERVVELYRQMKKRKIEGR